LEGGVVKVESGGRQSSPITLDGGIQTEQRSWSKGKKKKREKESEGEKKGVPDICGLYRNKR